MTQHWRDKARPIVAEVLQANLGQPPEVIKAALFAAYPFGPRKYFPYKIWLDECKRQRYGIAKKAKKAAVHEDQVSLFTEELGYVNHEGDGPPGSGFAADARSADHDHEVSNSRSA